MLGIYCRTSIKDEKDGVPTIDQQVRFGIDFAKAKGFDFKVYEDEGKSGYKIADEDNPFKDRPGFLNLLDDIKKQIINKVWIWGQDRLSRDQLATAKIYSLFKKNSIILYDKEKEYNVKDPQVKMLMGILGAVAEFERNQIVSRITRGLHDRINMGKRTHANIYGYKNIGKDDKGYVNIEPVKSEIEKIKIIFNDFLKGNTLASIALKLHGKGASVNEDLASNQRIRHILEHFEYTGYSLNMKGVEILKKFNNFEIDTLSTLKDNQYYNPSKNYTKKIVSVEDWIKIRERLRLNREVFKEKPETRSAGKAIATGLIKCGFCNAFYYRQNIKKKTKAKNGELKVYENDGYHHNVKISRQQCSQYPKTIKVERIDVIFKLFFFYFYLVFDNTKELIEEAQKEIKIRIEELNESVKTEEKEVSKIKKQIEKFNDIIDTDNTIDTATIKSLIQRINALELREKDKSKTLAKNRILLEQERNKFDNNERKNAYYNTKDKILGFLKADIETQRNEIRRIVSECYFFNNHLLIVANKRLFLFNIEEKYPFDEKALKNLINDKVFMANFIRDYDAPIEKSAILDKMNEDVKALLEIDKDILNNIDFDTPLDNKESVKDFLWEYEAKQINNTWINNINLNLSKYRAKMQKIFSNHNINYNLKDIEYFISFEEGFITKLIRTKKRSDRSI
ncbi:hypothetical protein FACS189450_06340 [Spirochaetia bacterium]|nr:hypothetical protein FACS189450_06340 [Spirochaetia bacterium]